MKEAGKNPYVEQLAREFAAIDHGAGTEYALKATTFGEGFTRLAEYVVEHLLAPKNQKIHDLTSELAKLQGQLHRLDKVLAVHNAGVCKDGESPIDCAIRLLSPIPDDLPKRDRP